jgi:hypothetical protein
MYEMRAESTLGRGELMWHVIAKHTPASTLCGSHLTRSPDVTADEASAEHYCASCMSAFSSAVRAEREYQAP